MSEYRLIPLGGKNGEGKFVKVSLEDYEKLSCYPWRFHYMGYARRHAYRPDGTRTVVYMHREVMVAPSGTEVDHRDGDKLNNTRENLRVCSRSQNQRNQKKQKGTTTSKYKGVFWYSERKKWGSHIYLNSKKKNLGYYESEEEAAKVYDTAAKKHYGEFAKLNL